MNLSKIDQYFMTKDAPGGRIRRLDLKRIRSLLVGIGISALIVILFLPSPERPQPPGAVSIDTNMIVDGDRAYRALNVAKDGDFYVSNAVGASSKPNFRSSRQLAASQLVPSQNGLGQRLSSGTTLSAKLLNRIVTSDINSPVIAVVTGDGEVSAGTKVVGNAQAESGSDRVQVTFHTMILENGNELPFQAVAVMGDGSSGIIGDYHSQMLKKEGGRILSHFVGGFAEAYKDRQSGGIMPLEPGNLKNAVLGGVSESATEQAKAYSEEMKNVRPYVTVEPGTTFGLFFEKGLGL